MKSFALVAWMVFSLGSLACAQGTYAQFDVPDALQTFPYGINAAGDIVGQYEDTNFTFHGFLRSGSVYSIIDYPGCISTTLTGINDVGQIVGYCEVGVTAGFVYDLTSQSFVDLNIPNSSATYPYGINDLGMVAGYYLGKAAEVGFVKSGSTLDTLHVPNASATLAYGITASGEAVGNVIIGAGYGRLLANAGEYKLIEIPKVPGARVFGVSPEGAALVGSSKDNSHAFISRGKNTVLLQPASAVFAAANGVNASGVVVGYFTDAASATHGFTWTTLR